MLHKQLVKGSALSISILLFSFLFIGCIDMNAQQDPQFTQYMYNTVAINPAYAGSRGMLSIFGIHRAQWIGLEGAPTTTGTSIHTPLNDSRIGLGVSMLQDAIGPSNKQTLSADFSYTISTSENYKLSFGLKGTASLFSIDYTKLNRFDINDPRFQNNISNQFSPNIGAGLYLHSKQFYAGISVPFMLQSNEFNDINSQVTHESLHYYFMSGYVFEISESTKFKPAFLAKAVEGAPLQVDLSANFMLNNKFVLGGAWRWEAAMSGLAGFQVNDNWFIGYTYDADSTKLANYNSGSHELFMRYEFIGKKEKIVSPRFF
ncbi:type IX secretion system membrane protein PorP/SprF [Flavobacterium sp.]|jgi:type IX secretion system PorP/SprF family membrane protein|uniref:type IX secretion system membrane protein PorP/SprF n=1 Tax=Flavobacterium sp. TaxID=239 RepID=UPI0037C11075